MAESDILLARHLLSHPDDSAYRAAEHIGIHPRTAQRAMNRLRDRRGLDEPSLLSFLVDNRLDHQDHHFSHPSPERWLANLPAPVSLSGEDAAAIEGLDVVPNRHLFYVAEADLSLLVKDLQDAGGEIVGPEEANITLRVRDDWLVDDPEPLVERGQRLLDYHDSWNLRLREAARPGRLLKPREAGPPGEPAHGR